MTGVLLTRVTQRSSLVETDNLRIHPWLARVGVVIPLHGGARSNPRPDSERDNRWTTRCTKGGCKPAEHPGRRHLICLPSSRIGENPPYGMIGGIEETSASFEARSAPRSYPIDPRRPEPCAHARESMGEASVGECIGQPLSRVRIQTRMPKLFTGRKARRTAHVIASARPIRRGRRPSMCGRSLYASSKFSGETQALLPMTDTPSVAPAWP
jgi:hypothetical protein